MMYNFQKRRLKMKCPNCNSDQVLICMKALKRPYLRYFECMNCRYKSRKVELYGYRLIGRKSKWEIELESLEKEWEYEK